MKCQGCELCQPVMDGLHYNLGEDQPVGVCISEQEQDSEIMKWEQEGGKAA